MERKTRATPSLIGGRKSRRLGSGWVRTGKYPPKAIPEELASARGYQFPSTPATPKQLAALHRIMLDYMRNYVVSEFSQTSVELLGELFGLQLRRAKEVVANARNVDSSAEADLVFRVLHGMHTGEIAGILGTPKSRDTRWLFRLIHELDPMLIREDLPDHSRDQLIPLPPDALPDGPGNQTARIRDANGRERVVNVFNDPDGSRWMEDPERETNRNALMMWHAAFRIDFWKWLRGH